MARGASATLYLRGLPEALIRESKARAARRGITLTAYVAEVLEQAVATTDEIGAVAPGQDLAADLDWYRENRERLAAQYANQYLAIAEQQVVDHDAEFAPLAQRIRARFGARPVLMPRCVAGGRVVKLPSPRVGRP